MRSLAAATLALLAAGCGWKNPYSRETADLEYDLAVEDERVMALTRAAAWPWEGGDPLAPLGELQPNLDLWRATTVQTADGATLLAMKEASKARVESLRGRYFHFQSLPDRVAHYHALLARDALELEQKKLQILDGEIAVRGAAPTR